MWLIADKISFYLINKQKKMMNIEDFKEDLKKKQAIADKNGLTNFGIGYLTALERYEKLILSGVSGMFSAEDVAEAFIDGQDYGMGNSDCNFNIENYR